MQENTSNILYPYKHNKRKEETENVDPVKDGKKKEFHFGTLNISLVVISMCLVPAMVRHKLLNRIAKRHARLKSQIKQCLLSKIYCVI